MEPLWILLGGGALIALWAATRPSATPPQSPAQLPPTTPLPQLPPTSTPLAPPIDLGSSLGTLHPPAQTPPAQTPATPPPSPTPSTIDPMAAEVLRLTNVNRASGGTCADSGPHPPSPPLTWNAKLAAAAQAHSEWMAAQRTLSHTEVSQDNNPGSRVTAAGYTWDRVAENIAEGQTTPAEVVAAWMASTHGHCGNILNADYTELGVGIARSADGTIYWTQDFGRQMA